MARLEFSCHYCGKNFVDFLFDPTAEAISTVKCPICKSVMTEDQLRKEPEKGDFFGYEAGEAYRKKWLKPKGD